MNSTSQTGAVPNRGATRFMRWLTKPPSKWWRRNNRLIKAVFGHVRVARTFFGSEICCDLDDYIGIRIFHFGFWEPHISGFVLGRLRRGDVFCDVGANIGYYTLLAAHAVGPEGRVIAIEPSPPLFQVLEGNIARNRLNHVRAVRSAVAARPGTVALFSGPKDNAGMTTTVESRGHGKVAEVTALPLDQILTTDETKRLRLLKIDVEGAERPVLDRLIGTIGGFAPELEILVEMTADPAPQAAALVRRFRAAGFSAYALANPYDIQSYVSFDKVIPPSPLTLPLRAQTDVLFSRIYRAPVP